MTWVIYIIARIPVVPIIFAKDGNVAISYVGAFIVVTRTASVLKHDLFSTRNGYIVDTRPFSFILLPK